MIIKQCISGPYDCYQSVLANISNFYKHDYQAVAIGKVGFDYLSTNTDLIGNKIDTFNTRKNNKKLELIGLKKNSSSRLDECKEMIDELLIRGIPIVAWADLYDCVWNKAYNKYHFVHCFIINGIKDDKYQIMDPFFDVDCYEQSFDELVLFVNKCAAYFDSNNDMDLNELCQEISLDAKYYIEHDFSTAIFRFMTELQLIDWRKELLDSKAELYAVPLLDNLKIIGEQREAYSQLLFYVGRKVNQSYDNLGENMKYCSEIWKKIRLYLIKMTISNVSNIDYRIIQDKMNSIIELEKKTFNEIGFGI